MFALGDKGRGNNRVIACPFHMQSVPEHFFLHLATASARGTIRMHFDTSHHADAADIGHNTDILQGEDLVEEEILHPASPGSVYHMTKTLDQLLFLYYNKNDQVRITDLHQGIVWGTNTEATDRDPRLTNRFDYDGDYGTVLNRFLMQAAIGYPLTVHGTGGQTRAFIHIRDSVRCVQLALDNPPVKGERVKIFNQMTESHQVGELAKKVAALTGAQVNNLPNPRNEAVENDLIVDNRCFIELGLNPTTLDDGLLKEVVEIATRYADRCDRNRILCTSAWTKTQEQAIAR